MEGVRKDYGCEWREDEMKERAQRRKKRTFKVENQRN